MPKLSTQDNDRYRIGHMVEFCEKLSELSLGLSEELLEEDWIKTLAILRLFETLGEASRKVSEDLRSQFPEIPWRDIGDMRNYLIHGYDDIDYRLVWLTLRDEIPPLLVQLKVIRDKNII